MSLADEIAYLSATELAGRIGRRELSPVEVVDATIARIEARNPSLNAFVIDGYEDARARAREDERALMSGQELGPLHGVPAAIKDLFGFKPGWRNTFGGIRALKDHVADSYCAFVERLECGGANFVGKTNSPIEGFRGTCDNYLFGPTSTPFRLGRNSGGSSGGSAAAVADGLVPVAHGTDGGGSIRIPAAWCGVYGYKPSWGRSPFIIRPNAFAGDAPFLFEGPLTRTVEDTALAMSVLAGHDPADPYSIDGAVDWRGATRRSIKGWKIAYSADFDVYPVDPRIAATVDAAVRRFEQAGATVVEATLGIERPQRELSDLWCRLISPLNAMGLEDFKRQGIDLERDHHDDLPPEYWRWIEVGRRMSALDFFRDQEIRSEIYDAVQAVLADHHLLVTPTLACMPVANGADGNTKGPTEINGEAVDPLIGWCMTYFVNYTGNPAASVPAGLVDGLPVGMQIIGRRLADADVIAASAAFERLQPWHASYALCAERSLAIPPAP
ncbi:MAG: amidase [Alphaproteobacteria bacterium]|nr:amidase [Alphaproteobacteria bacterium]